jgi:hypothetical protein
VAHRASVVPIASRIVSSPRGALGLLATLASLAVLAPAALAKPSYLTHDRSLVNYYVAAEGAKLGVSLPGGTGKFIELTESAAHTLVEAQPDGTTVEAAAETSCHSASGSQEGPAASCRITVARIAHEEGEGELRSTIAHEVFHVFQAVMSLTLQNFNRKESGWLTEGSATWVEAALVHNAPTARSWWETYLRSPHVPLFSRTYSAVGFFGHLASSGVSPWSKFKAMFAATSNDAAYAAAVGSNQLLLNSEASMFFREPSFGSAWDVQGPDVPSPAEVGFKPTNVKMAGAQELLSVAPYSDGAYHVTTKKMPAGKPILEVRVSGAHIRLHSTEGGNVNAIDPGNVKLCTDSKGCSCPGRPSAALEQFKEGDLAITGGPTGGDVWLVPHARCETLLGPRSCEGLLPGFTIALGKTLEEESGAKLAQETGNPAIGYYSSVCAFPVAKGESVENAQGESVFDGATAILVEVTRYPSVTQAEGAFTLPPPLPSPAAPPTAVPGIGSQAGIVTANETNGAGEKVFASFADVRVDNVLASFSLLSSGGSDEADPPSTLMLLSQVASELAD